MATRSNANKGVTGRNSNVPPPARNTQDNTQAIRRVPGMAYGEQQELVEQQQSLLTSLQEAPAQSYNVTEPPAKELGKPGDYAIDTENKNIYGPKTSSGWPAPVNF